MDALLEQIQFDCLALEYLSIIEAKITPHNIQAVRDYFKNDADSLLDGILNIDHVRKSKNKTIFLTKVKRFNKRRKTA